MEPAVTVGFDVFVGVEVLDGFDKPIAVMCRRILKIEWTSLCF
jgi:hypothetical protein